MKPGKNIFESTLIGTGGGYGECLVIHLGNDNWIIIDSCINPKTNFSLPIEYLESIGVNLETEVKLIVCTHWHDDHIRGISDLLEKCKSAVFTISAATDRKKFLRLVGLDYRKAGQEISISSTIELNKCLDIVEKRKSIIKRALEDKNLLSGNENGFSYEVYALSPSDFIMDQFDAEISTLISDYGSSNRKIIIESPNDKSVVIFIKVNDLRILLGADLEVDYNSNEKGWLRILDSSQVFDKVCTLFKVPHHGSENGDHDRIWEELLAYKPISKITPWNKKKKLPNVKMLKKISSKSELTFITSTFNSLKPKPKDRDKDINKIIKTMKPSLHEVRFHYGRVICRANINSPNSIWSIEVEGSAVEVDKLLLTNYPIQ